MTENISLKHNKDLKKIGNYVLGKDIGQGTFGKVKLGLNIQTGEKVTYNIKLKKVAIKILDKEKILEQSDIERVAREIHILKKLKHPNIIQLYSIIETNDSLYMIMEYASGGELFEYIVSNKRINEKESCKYIQQILSGVEYLAKIGVVHRDLKPENLLFDENKNIKIVDFGLSNIYEQGGTLSTACGSPCYAAPEMILGHKYEGLLADIWSTGIIMYTLLCGYLPFEDDNTSYLYRKIVAGDFQIPKFVSQNAVDLLNKILNVNPRKRYRIDEIRNHQWFQHNCIQNNKKSEKSLDKISIEQNMIRDSKPVNQKVYETLNPQISNQQDIQNIIKQLCSNPNKKETTKINRKSMQINIINFSKINEPNEKIESQEKRIITEYKLDLNKPKGLNLKYFIKNSNQSQQKVASYLKNFLPLQKLQPKQIDTNAFNITKKNHTFENINPVTVKFQLSSSKLLILADHKYSEPSSVKHTKVQNLQNSNLFFQSNKQQGVQKSMDLNKVNDMQKQQNVYFQFKRNLNNLNNLKDKSKDKSKEIAIMSTKYQSFISNQFQTTKNVVNTQPNDILSPEKNNTYRVIQKPQQIKNQIMIDKIRRRQLISNFTGQIL